MAALRKASAIVIGIVSAILLATNLSALYAGKPAPPPPPVHYELKWLGTLGGLQSTANDINYEGVVVGDSYDVLGNPRPFVCSPPYDVIVDLNDIAPVPAGWTLTQAKEINSLGQIVGSAFNSDTSKSQAYVFDQAGGTLTLLPLSDEQSFSHHGYCINDLGEVAAVRTGPLQYYAVLYRRDVTSGDYFVWQEFPFGSPTAMNNFGQLVNVSGQLYDADTRTLFTFTDDRDIRDINDLGVFVGGVDVPSKKPPGSVDRAAYRDPDGPGPALEILTKGRTYGCRAYGVNLDADVCLVGPASKAGQNAPFIYTDEDGLLALNDLLVGTTSDLAKWSESSWVGTFVSAISDRSVVAPQVSHGWGRICGTATFRIADDANDPTEAFVLTPKP